VDINGVNMKMPPNRGQLKQQAPGVYRGQAGLMFCSLRAMEWEMVVEIDNGNTQLNVPFRFITLAPQSALYE
jgi:hypothetical protein